MKISNTAVVLAGGKSSRFGKDKAFAFYNGKPMIERILLQLYKEFSQVIIVTNEPDKFKTLNTEIVTDTIKGSGPLCGIHSGLIASTSDYSFVTACDMPYISSDLISLMRIIIETEAPDALVVSQDSFIEPFYAFYSRGLILKIEKYLLEEKSSVYSFLKQLELSKINISGSLFLDDCKGRDIFSNINNPEELNLLLC